MPSPSYAVLAPSEDPTTATALCTLLTEADTHLSAKTVSTLTEGIDTQAEVLVLCLAEGPLLDLTEELIQRLKGRKVIGVGYAAAELFGRLGLEINGGACAHYGPLAPNITIEDNNLLGTSPSPDPIGAAQALPQGLPLDNFAMYIPRYSQLLSVVDVIARSQGDENYAPIVRQGSYVLIGSVMPPDAWTPEYRELFRAIAHALHARPNHFLVRSGSVPGQRPTPSRWPGVDQRPTPRTRSFTFGSPSRPPSQQPYDIPDWRVSCCCSWARKTVNIGREKTPMRVRHL
jgi:hypothetical protein